MHRKALSTCVAMSIAVILSGCASGSAAPDNDSASAVSESTSPASASMTPSPTVEAAPENPDDALEYTKTGLPIKGVVNDGVGDYLKTTIRADDPLMIYNPSNADDQTNEFFTQEELQEAQSMIVRFIAEEFLDSTLNGNPTPEARQAWWSEHEDMFHSVGKEELKNDFLTYNQDKAPLFTGDWRKGTFGLVYGADQTHIHDREFRDQKVTVWVDEATGLKLFNVSMDYSVRNNNQFVTGDKKWGEMHGTVSWTAAIEDGVWKLGGYGGNTIVMGGEGEYGDVLLW